MWCDQVCLSMACRLSRELEKKARAFFLTCSRSLSFNISAAINPGVYIFFFPLVCSIYFIHLHISLAAMYISRLGCCVSLSLSFFSVKRHKTWTYEERMKHSCSHLLRNNPNNDVMNIIEYVLDQGRSFIDGAGRLLLEFAFA